jgi:hypothetical protein
MRTKRIQQIEVNEVSVIHLPFFLSLPSSPYTSLFHTAVSLLSRLSAMIGQGVWDRPSAEGEGLLCGGKQSLKGREKRIEGKE